MVSTKKGWLLKGNGAHKRVVFPYVEFSSCPFHTCEQFIPISIHCLNFFAKNYFDDKKSCSICFTISNLIAFRLH